VSGQRLLELLCVTCTCACPGGNDMVSPACRVTMLLAPPSLPKVRGYTGGAQLLPLGLACETSRPTCQWCHSLLHGWPALSVHLRAGCLPAYRLYRGDAAPCLPGPRTRAMEMVGVKKRPVQVRQQGAALDARSCGYRLHAAVNETIERECRDCMALHCARHTHLQAAANTRPNVFASSRIQGCATSRSRRRAAPRTTIASAASTCAPRRRCTKCLRSCSSGGGASWAAAAASSGAMQTAARRRRRQARCSARGRSPVGDGGRAWLALWTQRKAAPAALRCGPLRRCAWHLNVPTSSNIPLARNPVPRTPFLCLACTALAYAFISNVPSQARRSGNIAASGECPTRPSKRSLHSSRPVVADTHRPAALKVYQMWDKMLNGQVKAEPVEPQSDGDCPAG